MSTKLGELGLIDGDLLKIERGTPHEEETFLVQITQVTLIDGTSSDDLKVNDEVIFTKEPLFTYRV